MAFNMFSIFVTSTLPNLELYKGIYWSLLIGDIIIRYSTPSKVEIESKTCTQDNQKRILNY